VGQILAAGLTALASGAAAFLGVKTANRNTNVVDERAKQTADWDRLQRLVTMACSTNPTEAYVGVYHLELSKQDWNNNPEQRAFVRRTCEALNAPAVQAYRGGQTTVVTSPPPRPTGGP
jgi:hypothetical protein